MSAIPASTQHLTKAQVAATLAGFQAADWQRLKIISATACAGVPGLTPSDLQQEAMTKLLSGERVWPVGVHPLVVLANVMHSIASNARKREDNGPIDASVLVDQLETDADDKVVYAHGTVTITPEEELSGRQQIVALYASLGGDKDLELLVDQWADGVRGSEARVELGWDEKKYDAVRQRLLRRLAALDPTRRKS